MTNLEWLDISLAIALLAGLAVWWRIFRKVNHEWQLLSDTAQNMARSWADADTLWHAQVAYGTQVGLLIRAVRAAAGRSALADPRVQAAIDATDAALERVIALSAPRADTPAGDDVHQPARLRRLTSQHDDGPPAASAGGPFACDRRSRAGLKTQSDASAGKDLTR